MDRLIELARELRVHWDDKYWWLDHAGLRIALLSVVSGVIGLVFAYLQARMTRAMVTSEQG